MSLGAREVGSARFSAGQAVRVKDSKPEQVARLHLRTPHYARGRIGRVERVLGTFPNPEDIAFNRPAEPRVLYHVLFDQPPVWGEGQQGDTLLIELFEHWLEEA
ncbi:SH3-like domain-containing protein [Roseococcus sp. SYP-B2431]|uniref:SH3-like domain-containing protein n=1 Tax=Roseococcus sp. SYP-B2431 TaxID=2496640 RepID=UPI002107A630|nr:SH3-like domain-containing protein [Roseococcus sp. SYP-B2431]